MKKDVKNEEKNDYGRNDKKSTGIGLYLCKKLCLRLNHEIKISSNEKTTVTIIFPHSSFITLR